MKVLVQVDTKSRTRFLRDREICKKKSLSGGIPMSKELWRGPESIYTLKHGQCVAHDRKLTYLAACKLHVELYCNEFLRGCLKRLYLLDGTCLGT